MSSRIFIAITLMVASPAFAKASGPDDKDYGFVSVIKELGKAMFGGGFSKVRVAQSAIGAAVPLTDDKAGKAMPGQVFPSRQIETKPKVT